MLEGNARRGHSLLPSGRCKGNTQASQRAARPGWPNEGPGSSDGRRIGLAPHAETAPRAVTEDLEAHLFRGTALVAAVVLLDATSTSFAAPEVRLPRSVRLIAINADAAE